MDDLGEEIREQLGRFGAPEGIAALAEAWPAAVGTDIAANAWPARTKQDGTLVVHVRDSVWGFELTQRAADIAARLPGSPKLEFVPGPLPEEAAEEPAPLPPRASPEQEREAAELAAAITDPNLRESVAKTIRAALVLRSDDRSV
ncbi:MAG TPA: DciA family protein [Gaiellaceae bacterium]|nr:DciA family protein [Gaiellaceae bacterium]